MVNRLRYLVPNAFTGLSLVFGFMSVTCSIRGDLELAGWMVVWGVLLDKLDGTAARLLKATSQFGMEFDSFADFMVFGVAPGVLYFQAATAAWVTEAMGDVDTFTWLMRVACGYYVLAAGIRLARFNVKTEKYGDRYFFGLPSTVSGALTAGTIITALRHEAPAEFYRNVGFLIVFMGTMMVTNFRLPKLKVRKQWYWNAIQLLGVVAIYSLGVMRAWPEVMMTIGTGYCVFGFIAGAVQRPQDVPVRPIDYLEPEDLVPPEG